MSKKLLITLSFVLLIGVAVFVSAVNKMTPISQDGYNYDVEVKIEKGWNLILGFDLDSIRDSSQIKKANILASYVYLPNYKRYIQYYPDKSELNTISSDLAKGKEGYFSRTPFWIYSTKAGILSYHRVDTAKYSEVELGDGWNFITVGPDMYTGTLDGAGYEGEFFSWNSIKGTCIYEKIYAWNPESQEWVSVAPDLIFKEYDFDDFIGNGMVIKVADDCGLSKTTSLANPPAIPSDTSSNSASNDNFPNKISDFVLRSTRLNDKSECGKLDGADVCIKMSRLEYVDSSNMAVHVLPTEVTTGKQAYINYIKSHSSESNVGGNLGVYRGDEPWELYWFTNSANYQMIGTQDYKYIPQSDGSTNSQTLNATTTNSVTRWFLNNYSPIST